MSLSFPQNPVLNQTTSTGNKTWTWNGKAWTITAFTGNVVVSDGELAVPPFVSELLLI
jgi:hypothetical protein